MKRLIVLIPLLFLAAGCVRIVRIDLSETPSPEPSSETAAEMITPTSIDQKRPHYIPGELVEYKCLSGDTLPALATRFNTTETAIRQANPVLPEHVTTLPQGLPLQIPIYYRSSWGSSYKMIPDALFVNGPAQSGFSARAFTDRQKGWFKYYKVFSSSENRRGGEIVDYVADNYSVSPRLLLAVLEYVAHALSVEQYPEEKEIWNVLGFSGENYHSLSAQFNQLADTLNETYYNYKAGSAIEYELQDGSLFRFDPWLNAASAALQAYFAKVLSPEAFFIAIGPEGFVKTYKQLFGDFPPVDEYPAHIEGSLEQIELALPYADGEAWTYTGGPHTGWGNLHPYSAIDFAPPTNEHGCFASREWVLAPHSGIVVRKDTGQVMLDLDGDGDEHTGWVMLFLHLKTESTPPLGAHLEKGDRLGHPSCDGGTSSGTHVHLARKYNGEWMPAGGVIPLNMSDWIVSDGDAPYEGKMTRYSSYVTASASSEYYSRVLAGPPILPTKLPKEKK